MEDCIFCKVIKKEVPGYFIFEDEDVVSFLDIFGSVEGHLMVVPKRHGLSILDYSEEELGKVMSGVKKAAEKLKKAYNCDSITIGINHLEKKGAPHLHVHLIPRFDDDGGKVIQSMVKKEIKEALETIAKKIREA